MLLSDRLQQTANFNTEMGWTSAGSAGGSAETCSQKWRFVLKHVKHPHCLQSSHKQRKTCHQGLHLQRPRVFPLAPKSQVTPQISGKNI